MTRPRALVSWSSGKDSAWALFETLRSSRLEIAGLLTTVTEAYGRVSIHGVRDEVLALQAAAAGLPCRTVRLPAVCSNEDYERAFGRALARARAEGIQSVVFGDLFLADVRSYRERVFAGTGVTPEFPLWGRDTGELAREMIAGGMRAILVCVDPRRVPGELAGRDFDAGLLDELPREVDPCGENGEFHTCVTDGPMFARPIAVERGEVVSREGFVFADLRPSVRRSASRQTPGP